MERFWVYRAPHGLPVADALLAAHVVGPSDVAALLAEVRRLRAALASIADGQWGSPDANVLMGMAEEALNP